MNTTVNSAVAGFFSAARSVMFTAAVLAVISLVSISGVSVRTIVDPAVCAAVTRTALTVAGAFTLTGIAFGFAEKLFRK